MIRFPKTAVCGIVLTLSVGVSSLSLGASDIRPLPMIIADLERHIAELQLNISKVENRMTHLQGASPSTDPLIQQLQALDIQGWTLHEEQWKYQLQHLRRAEEFLRSVSEEGEGKPALLKRWEKHRQQYEDHLKAYRNQRHRIEEERLRVEGKMIGRYFQ